MSVRSAAGFLVLLVSVVAGATAAASDDRSRTHPGVEADPIAEAIARAVRSRMGTDAVVTLSDVSVTGRLIEPPFLAVPAPGARTGGSVRFQIVGSDRHRRVRTIGWATASVHVAVEHVRLRQLVSRGEALSDDDVSVSRDDVPGVPLRWLPRWREVQGARALTNLAPGMVLLKSAVLSRPAVRSGQVVRGTARVAGVEVEAQLVAVQDGDPGMMVRVVNKDTRRELRARVVEAGHVEVVDE